MLAVQAVRGVLQSVADSGILGVRIRDSLASVEARVIRLALCHGLILVHPDLACVASGGRAFSEQRGVVGSIPSADVYVAMEDGGLGTVGIGSRLHN